MEEHNALAAARRCIAQGDAAGACRAYGQALEALAGRDPDGEMEAALHILQLGGDHTRSFDTFVSLYHRCTEYRADCMNLLLEAFYLPNAEELQKRYEKNCRLLGKYPYLFRRDFLPFDELPLLFFPYDDEGFRPFSMESERFGEYVDVNTPVISHHFFADLEKPVLAADVYSQYELEYLRDNVRKSEWVGRENHIYLHYSDWGIFCAHLQVLDWKELLREKKFVFLIGDEIEQYPIDFQARFGVDYSQYPVKPLGIREINRLIWHAQLSAHNGGDFFNEVFDGHPNLLYMSSVMMDDMEQLTQLLKMALKKVKSKEGAVQVFSQWDSPHYAQELYDLKNRTDKDIFVALFLMKARRESPLLDQASRIVPAIFFQPHFPRILWDMAVYASGDAVLQSGEYDRICRSPIFGGFRYIKTFLPLRRVTTSYAASVRFALLMNQYGPEEARGPLGDTFSKWVLNRSFLTSPADRLFQDSTLVRFEDAKLNPTATFSALAAFVDLPYTQSMTRCTFAGQEKQEREGFSTGAVYRTYDEYVGPNERYLLEYFMQDVYARCGYDLQYYDGAPVDEERMRALMEGFSVRYGHNRKSMTEQELREMMDQAATNAAMLMRVRRFVDRQGRPLRWLPLLPPDPARLEQPLYR